MGQITAGCAKNPWIVVRDSGIGEAVDRDSERRAVKRQHVGQDYTSHVSQFFLFPGLRPLIFHESIWTWIPLPLEGEEKFSLPKAS